jgi:signal peptidase I
VKINPEELKSKAILWFKDTFETLFVALVLALIIRAFLLQVFWIPSESMVPTLNINDRLIVNKLAYGVENPFYRFDLYDKFLYVIPNPFYTHRNFAFNFKYFLEFPFQPGRFEVAVFRFPSETLPDGSRDLIKRVIGLPGETIQLKRGVLYVNGKMVEEKHQMFNDYSNYGPVTVPARNFLMMGDNRPNSNDGRFWGFVPKEEFSGPAVIRIWPLTKLGFF